ncbi:DUF2062 domain-containing protein [Bartonella tamiae]|uniref:DUF2062 domain-containing protein n=1 Tax=Bartonella tamiae Th239 TaxID=1094558 RepID=J0R4N6_9HYPH|nr:DUF2062 domain-containing protein [Bartonella tamiae]EJF90629.1 hypothetical protein ME5_01030 [Bartonella tamiae Th239]EJF93994.1 hypothetical protein MEG_00852 [Bartonella tamiae Th307]
MLFRRRKPMTFFERVRVWLWPRSSFSRSLRYMGKRILRIRATPHRVALGLAIGVLAGCSPLFGLHIIIALIFAWILRGNMAAAALGTLLSNPLTFFPIVAADYKLGHKMLSLFGHVDEIPLSEIKSMFDGVTLSQGWSLLMEAWDSVMKPMLLGGAILGLALGAVAYIFAYRATFNFQKKRHEKMSEKNRMRLHKQTK